MIERLPSRVGPPRGGVSTDRIRNFNDAFRRDLPKVANGNQLLLTAGIRALGGEQTGRMLIALRDHAASDWAGQNASKQAKFSGHAGTSGFR